MKATCKHCGESQSVDRDEDGYPSIPAQKCAEATCEVWLCFGACEHLGFSCVACNSRFCESHGLTFSEGRFCFSCALEAVEAQEPECECRQTDVDLFDARGCELHDARSPWNVRLRAVTACQQLERQGAA